MFDSPGEVSHSRSGSGANTDHGGPQLDSGVDEVTLNSCVVGYTEVEHAATARLSTSGYAVTLAKPMDYD
jgi:hypothetical protein